MNKGFSYFRVKTSYKGENTMGAIENIKSEDLVMAANYTEAEKLAYMLLEDLNTYNDDAEIEIVKTKISEIIFNDTFAVEKEWRRGLNQYYFEESEDTEVGLYQVSVVFTIIDEKTGKQKNETETIYTPAYSSSKAIINVHEYLKEVGETRDYIIRNVKYDKAQSVIVIAQD